MTDRQHRTEPTAGPTTGAHRTPGPQELTFLLTLIGGLTDRYRRLRRDPDAGGVSIETAIIIAALVGAAVALGIAITALVNKYVTPLKND